MDLLEERNCNETKPKKCFLEKSYHPPLIFSLVNVQKKIHMGMNMLQYFSMRKWDFRLEKGANIGRFLTSEEDEIFPSYVDKPDIEEYMKNCVLGGRQFCLKEPLTSLPKARVMLNM